MLLNPFFLDELLEYLEARKEVSSLLDLGCGTGDAAVKFANRNIAVTGIDFSSEALGKARERAKKSAVEDMVVFQEADLDDFDISALADRYDVIFSKNVYAFLEDKEGFLKKVKAKIDKDNGRFVLMISVLFADTDYSNLLKNISVPHDETRELLDDIFDEVEVHDINYLEDKEVKITYVAR